MLINPSLPPPSPLRRAQVTSLLDHLLEGFSVTLFAYGPTGSGKTFSFSGIPDAIVRLAAAVIPPTASSSAGPGPRPAPRTRAPRRPRRRWHR